LPQDQNFVFFFCVSLGHIFLLRGKKRETDEERLEIGKNKQEEEKEK